MTENRGAGSGGEWFRSYYGDDYMASVRDLLDGARTERETDFLVRATGVMQGARVADLGCGEGRHALQLARRGLQVTAIDLNAQFLERGRAEAQRQGLEVDWVLGDMRTPQRGPFDLVLLLFHSFGFFSDLENLSLLRDWRQQLGPWGHLAIDVWNREGILQTFVARATRTVGGGLSVLEERAWEPRTQRLQVHYRYRWQDGRERGYDASYRLYGKEELEALLREAGGAVQICGGTSLQY